MSASRGADDREAFIKACADGNTRRVRRLLDQGADVEAAVDGQPANYPLWVDPKTWYKLCMRAPMQIQYTGLGSAQTRAVVPTNAKPLRKLFLKHYAILVRLHAIGTPSTRLGPDKWLLEARHHAPLIASFLSPQATRKAWSYWNHNVDCSMRDLLWKQDDMYGPPIDWPQMYGQS